MLTSCKELHFFPDFQNSMGWNVQGSNEKGPVDNVRDPFSRIQTRLGVCDPNLESKKGLKMPQYAKSRRNSASRWNNY